MGLSMVLVWCSMPVTCTKDAVRERYSWRCPEAASRESFVTDPRQPHSSEPTCLKIYLEMIEKMIIKDKDKDKEFLFPMQQSGSLSPLLQRQDRGQ